MKKLLLTLLFILSLPIAILAQTEPVVLDDEGKDDQNVNYGFFDNSTLTCMVIDSPEATGSITIPEKVEYNGNTYTVTKFGSLVFYNCSDLTSIVIPNSITSIGNDAFRETGLTSVMIPESVTEIGVAAFYGCLSLTDATVKANIKSIPSCLFYGCLNLKTVKVPESVTSIGVGAFYDCQGLESFEIPNTVTSIEEYTFGFCTSLSSIIIPNSVTSIGSEAFSDCTNLSEVTIGSGVESIAEDAFPECYSIRSIIYNGTNPPDDLGNCFPDDVYENAILNMPYVPIETAQNSSVFQSFNYVKASDAVIKKDGNILCYSISLNKTAVNLDLKASLQLKATVLPDDAVDNSLKWSTSDETVATVDQDGNVTAEALGEAIITATATDGSNQSASCKITVKLPYHFIYGGIEYTIMDLENKTCIVAENGGNSGLIGDIVIPKEAGHIDGTMFTVKGISERAFNGCIRIKSVDIKAPISEISGWAFTGCTDLTEIKIPDSVTSIGQHAFERCSSLSSIEIPNKVTSIEDFAFIGCLKLNSIIIPNSVTSIGTEAFSDCLNLSKVTIGSGVKTIGEYAFSSRSIKYVTYNGNEAVRFSKNCFYEDEFDEDENVYTSAKFTAPNLTNDNFLASSWTYFKDTAIKLSAIALIQDSWQGYVGEFVELSVSLDPVNAIQTKIVWSTSDPEIATVDESGKVTAVAVGDAVITATATDNAEIKAVCAVKVNPTLVTSISLDKESLELIVKQSATLSATILPEDATDKTVTWSTSDETIATVDAEGKVTAVSVGEVTVTAVANGGTDVSASCKVKVLPILVSAITLNETEVSLRVNGSVTLTAEVSPADATNSAITCSTSDETIATVDESGKVTAVALGTAVITATAADGSGVKAECTIKVIPTPVSGITLSETEVSLRVNGSVTLTATLSEDATNKAVVWSTSDAKIATVDENGKVTAVALGEAVITATAADGSGVKAECTIKVVPTPVGSISLNKESLELTVKQSATLTVTILPEDATDKTVTWSTSDETIATVDESGKVTAVALGTAVITATAADGSGVKADCTIKVVPTPVSGITLNETEVSLRVNGSVTLTATVNTDATNSAITWSTSDAKIATVDESGKVTAITLGTAVITATAADGSGVKAECTIKVIPTPVSSIVLNETEVSLRVNGSVTLTATVNSDATDKTILWASSDEKVATVDQSGKVTAIAVGDAEITATAADGSGVTEVCYIEVLPPLAESITLNVEEYSAKVGERFTLIATVTPEEAADQPLIWESSDPEIATVTSAGVVEVLAPGEVTITVTTTDGSDLSASCLVYLSSGIRAVFAETNYRADIYNLGGVLIRRDATLDDFNALAPGIYIVNHRKLLKK